MLFYIGFGVLVIPIIRIIQSDFTKILMQTLDLRSDQRYIFDIFQDFPRSLTINRNHGKTILLSLLSIQIKAKSK